MPETKAKMTCPCCGAELVCHAEKPVKPTCAEEAMEADPGLGAVIKEIHTCPNCGTAELRRGG
ncbi:MAG: hypothetical protein HY236_08970 [Acidobacteria bacterium]|nr:hypothetical protein [Acidobacteriota bacterium]